MFDLLVEVFPVHPVPVTLFQDEPDDSEFCEDITQNFASKPWPSLTLESWTYSPSVEVMSHYMKAEAFHYYLPSLISVTLEANDYVDLGLKAILPRNNAYEPKGEWWNNYYSCFTRSQIQCIQVYLDKVLETAYEGGEEEYLAKVALNKIWV